MNGAFLRERGTCRKVLMTRQRCTLGMHRSRRAEWQSRCIEFGSRLGQIAALATGCRKWFNVTKRSHGWFCIILNVVRVTTLLRAVHLLPQIHDQVSHSQAPRGGTVMCRMISELQKHILAIQNHEKTTQLFSIPFAFSGPGQMSSDNGFDRGGHQ